MNVRFVDIGVNCWPSLFWEKIVRFVDIGVNCWPSLFWEMIVRFVDIGVNCWPSLFKGVCSFCWYWWNYWPSLFSGVCSLCWRWWNYWPSLFRDVCSPCWYWCELLTITVQIWLFALLILMWTINHHCINILFIMLQVYLHR